MNQQSICHMKSMKLNHQYFILISFFMVVVAGGLISCQSDEIQKSSYNVLLIVAHPDDETLVSGTLAKFTDLGCNVSVAYITSGDDGTDMTGKGLWGEPLARQRESEARRSLKHIGVTNPPLFLKYPDSHVLEYSAEIEDTLFQVFLRLNPDLVITFGSDGVTNDPDHITTGAITDRIFDATNTGKLLLHIAISQKACHIYPIPSPVPDHLIDLHVNVSRYRHMRFMSNSSHRTQFGVGQRLFWRIYVRRFPFEEFVIENKRAGGNLIINDCLK